MPMEKVPASEALTKAELHQRFRDWLENTEEPIIGPETVHARTAWLHVRDGEKLFKLDPDTKRAAVEEYLQLVTKYGDNIEWHIVDNKIGNRNAVAFGPELQKLNNTLYLYLLDPV